MGADTDERRPLWAPWRIEYIEKARGPQACIFCEPAAGRSDRERLILHRGRHVFVLLNRYPYAPGHLMVAPYAHSGKLDDARRRRAGRADGAGRARRAHPGSDLSL